MYSFQLLINYNFALFMRFCLQRYNKFSKKELPLHTNLAKTLKYVQ